MASPAELPAILEALKARAEHGAKPAVIAMAERYRRYVVAELQLSRAEIGQFGTPAPRGAPPAWRSGELTRSVRTMAGPPSGWVATASVAPHTIYARTQEYGQIHRPTRFRYMHWFNVGGPRTEWFKKIVDIPARPYLRPAHKAVIADGSLTRAAMAAWVAAVGV